MGVADTSRLEDRRPTRRELLVGWVVSALAGAMALIYLHGSGLASASKYHDDLTQSPHWLAYHGDAFAKDDLLVEYATFNESPVQNAIYWAGTWLVDVVLFNKLVGIAIFGLTAGLFFALVSSTSGIYTGALAALFFVLLPRSTYEIAGGFSKAWAIGLTLVGVWVVEKRSWRTLLWVMPFAALAYPVAPVLIGATVLVGLALELPRAAGEAFSGLKQLTVASALGVLPLLYKYVTPPARIGAMISPAEMHAIWERGDSTSGTLPLWQELYSYLEHPFFIYGTILLVLLLLRSGGVWQRSWSALVLASATGYYVADLVAPRLYLPDRYIRFSFTVLAVLFYSHNWARVLGTLRTRWARGAALAAVVVLALGVPPATFKPCSGRQSEGLWEDWKDYAPVSQAIVDLPLPVLVAGHPYVTSEVLVQARRPVLVINRMVHDWFTGYHQAMDARIRDTFSALYARDAGQVNNLVTRYGVTHLIVRKRQYAGERFKEGRMYRPEYTPFIAKLTHGPKDFVLNPPPREAIVFENHLFWLVRLPLE